MPLVALLIVGVAVGFLASRILKVNMDTPSTIALGVLGALIDSADAVNRRWEIIQSLDAGRYIIRVTGTTNAMGSSAYTGQLAFIPEPGTLALLGFGLLGMGLARRRKV